MKNNTFLLSALAAAATTFCTSSLQAQIVWDGVLNGIGGNDNYTNSEVVNWSNGHNGDNSLYNPVHPEYVPGSDQTVIRYANSGGFFWLYVQAPLYAKNMVWADDLNNLDADVVESYRLGEGNLHQNNDGSPDLGRFDKLDYGTATGSEKVEFGSYTGDFEDNLESDVRDSIDYLFANSLATSALSTNYNLPMSFEFRFAESEQADVLAAARGGLVFHLSPERYVLIPEPSSALLLGVSSVFMLMRRKRLR